MSKMLEQPLVSEVTAMKELLLSALGAAVLTALFSAPVFMTTHGEQEIATVKTLADEKQATQ